MDDKQDIEWINNYWRENPRPDLGGGKFTKEEIAKANVIIDNMIMDRNKEKNIEKIEFTAGYSRVA